MNIYITISDKDKIELLRLSQKYKISFSTIADIITNTYQIAGVLNKISNEYIYKDRINEIHIKPKQNRLIEIERTKLNKTYTNAVQLYLKKELKQKLNIDNVLYARINNQIAQEFANRQEINWNYNANFRQQCRMFRNNKDYFKKVFGKE